MEFGTTVENTHIFKALKKTIVENKCLQWNCNNKLSEIKWNCNNKLSEINGLFK